MVDFNSVPETNKIPTPAGSQFGTVSELSVWKDTLFVVCLERSSVSCSQPSPHVSWSHVTRSHFCCNSYGDFVLHPALSQLVQIVRFVLCRAKSAKSHNKFKANRTGRLSWRFCGIENTESPQCCEILRLLPLLSFFPTVYNSLCHVSIALLHCYQARYSTPLHSISLPRFDATR